MPAWWIWTMIVFVAGMAIVSIASGKPGAAAAIVLLFIGMFIPKLFMSRD